MCLQGVQNGGNKRTQRTKLTEEKSKAPQVPQVPWKRYARPVSKMREHGVQNVFVAAPSVTDGCPAATLAGCQKLFDN